MDASSNSQSYRSLRREAFVVAGLTLLGTASLAAFVATTLTLSSFAVWRAASVPLAWIALTASHIEEHAHDRLGPANQITALRAVLVGVLAALVFEAPVLEPWTLVFAAGLVFGLDGVDGLVARRTGTASPFGARLDLELDGLFVLVLCGLVQTVTDAGAWVWSAGLARYAFIASARVAPFMARPLPPARRRPWACGIGVGLLVAALAPLDFGLPELCAAVGVATIVGSFAIDVAWLLRHREGGPW